MEKSNINLSDETSGLFSDLPPSVKTRVKNGFSILAEMPRDRLAELAEVVKKSIGVKQPPFEKYASTLDIPLEDFIALISAAALSASFLAVRTISAEEFVQATIDKQLVEESDKAIVSEFAQIVIDQAGPISDAMDRSYMSSLIIPLFTSLNAVIDVRLQFEEGRVQTAVPVVILHLSTDMDDEKIVLQTTKDGIEQIIEHLQDVKNQLQTTEEWIRQRSLRKGE